MCGLQVLDVAEAAHGFLDSLDCCIDGFPSAIRDVLPQIGEHVGEGGTRSTSRPPPSADAGCGAHASISGRSMPGRLSVAESQNCRKRSLMARPCHLEGSLLHRMERGPLRGRDVWGAHEPAVLGPPSRVSPACFRSRGSVRRTQATASCRGLALGRASSPTTGIRKGLAWQRARHTG